MNCNIQVALASHRGRGRASISVVGRAMLQSLIAIDSLPSDLSGPEVVWILHSLPTLRRFSDRSHETFSGHHYRTRCLTKRGEADSLHVRQFFYRCADSSFYDASPFLFRQPISVSMMPVHFCFSVSMMPVHFCTKNQKE